MYIKKQFKPTVENNIQFLEKLSSDLNREITHRIVQTETGYRYIVAIYFSDYSATPIYIDVADLNHVFTHSDIMSNLNSPTILNEIEKVRLFERLNKNMNAKKPSNSRLMKI